ncbi:MAG: uroporphyrinogen decarboxylase family protein [Planctomycetota bacterium]
MTDFEGWPGPVGAEPDFSELLKVLRRDRPSRPVLVELFMNNHLYEHVTGIRIDPAAGDGPRQAALRRIKAFRNLGYDYVTLHASDFSFPAREVARDHTISLNDGAMIVDRRSFERYPWPDPERFSSDLLDDIRGELPGGMKVIVIGPCGVLENVVRMVGYENLCLMSFDDPALVGEIFDAVGSRLLRYYEQALRHDAVGAIWVNDDWGFKTQTMLSPADMRRFVIPWHRKIAAAAHAAGRPTILHSCGRLHDVMDDVIGVIHHDGRHSYEDAIEPVEQAYERLSDRIAVIGGIDVDFICRSTPAGVYARARAMLERSRARGAYALGTGNSVPEYVPRASYIAMLAAANQERDPAWVEWAERLSAGAPNG